MRPLKKQFKSLNRRARRVSFLMEKPVGEGFLSGGRGFVGSTQNVQAVFKNGKLLTLYPKIE